LVSIRDKEGKIVNVYAEGGKEGGQVLGGFFRGKFNPVSGLTYDYLLNDKKGFYNNKPITLNTAGEQLFVPMSLRAVNEQVERDGALDALKYVVPNFVGIQMKDTRDYTSTDLFTPKEKEQGALKILSDKGVKIPSSGTKGQHKVDIVGDNEGLMTDEQWSKFNEYRKDYIEEELPKMLKKKYDVTVETPSQKIVSSKLVLGKDLGKDELQDKVEAITADATKFAKEKMKLIKPKNKTIVEEY